MAVTRDLLVALEREPRIDASVNGVALILERREGVVVILREASAYGTDVLGLFNRLSMLDGAPGFPVVIQERMYVAMSCERAEIPLADALRAASQYSL